LEALWTDSAKLDAQAKENLNAIEAFSWDRIAVQYIVFFQEKLKKAEHLGNHDLTGTTMDSEAIAAAESDTVHCAAQDIS
jgi:hypothetical protein